MGKRLTPLTDTEKATILSLYSAGLGKGLIKQHMFTIGMAVNESQIELLLKRLGLHKSRYSMVKPSHG